jgi:hypothetical protein
LKERFTLRIREALTTLLLLCLGLRLAAWLIAPLVPVLIVMGALTTALLIATSWR